MNITNYFIFFYLFLRCVFIPAIEKSSNIGLIEIEGCIYTYRGNGMPNCNYPKMGILNYLKSMLKIIGIIILLWVFNPKHWNNYPDNCQIIKYPF